MGRRGHTTPADIAKTERAAAVLRMRFEGMTLSEIAAVEGVSVPTISRTIWRALDQTAPCRHDRIDR